MLITSRTIRGKCPVCGAAGCTCGGPSAVAAVDERMTLAGRGPLRSYPIGRGVSIQLTDEEARRRGLLPAEPEPGPRGIAPLDKMRRPPARKGR